MRSLLREPLVHFVLIGAALFAVSLRAGGPSGSAPGAIVVTRADVDAIGKEFARTWQRAPTPAELDGLIQDRVREEVYCREAMALGLDKDDAIIRRRLRQKLEFISEDVAAVAEPKDDELRDYFRAHRDAFAIDPRFTFRHVFLDPTRHPGTFAADAETQRARLNGGADPDRAGDPFLFDHSFEGVPKGVVAKQFGDGFAARLDTLRAGSWQGPIESGYGAHLVLLKERVAGRVPELDEVKDRVRMEWSQAKRLEANEAFYRKLREKYTVTIERPSSVE